MKKILVVEDAESILEIVLEILQGAGFEVQGARTGAAGVRLAREVQPDLVVCDVMMPELDGYGVLRQLRQEPDTALTPFIFLTAKSTREDVRRGMNLGADDYLTKPFTAEELLSAVRTRLRKQELLAERQAMHLAHPGTDAATFYSSLTGLPNRLLLNDRLRRAIRSADGTRFIGLLFIDLDRFRSVNDALGRGSGDRVLKVVANRLGAAVRPEDTVFHIAEDKFAVLCPELEDEQEADALATRVLHAVRQPIACDNHQLNITASAGISLYPSDSDDCEALLLCAEMAMHHSREQGRNHYEFYNASMRARASDRLSLESALHHALETHAFTLHYQPQLDLKTGRIFGMEALLRWKHPQLGAVPPAKFIPVAEETGLILPIGEWTLRTACAQTKSLRQAGFPDLRVAVNLSAHQLQEPGLIDKLSGVLQRTGLDPKQLELELTESIIMKNPEATIAVFRELKSMGISISIDDFGTGYSSLSYLKRFPIDTLKIDQSFIRDITSDAEGGAIAIAIITMAQSLGIEVIAEGVETDEQAAFLRAQGCNGMQGYYFSQAVSAERFLALLRENGS